MWQADPQGVRHPRCPQRPEEFVFSGHAPMAWNIPFAFLAYQWSEEKKGFPWSRTRLRGGRAGAVRPR